VYVRAAAGVRGASLYILVRAIVAIIYFATQTYYGGRITSVFMRGIFGNGYHNIPNHLPASAGITSRDLLSFFLFWMVSICSALSKIQLMALGANAHNVHSSDGVTPSVRDQSSVYNNRPLWCSWLGYQREWWQHWRLQVHYLAETTLRVGSCMAYDSS
jgi:hypothetical protein